MRFSSDPTELRAATLDDAPSIARLLATLGYPASVEALRGRLEIFGTHPDYQTIVAEIEGNVVGFVGLHRAFIYEQDGPCVFLLAIAVDESDQGRGVGTALVREAEAWTRAQGAQTISLSSGTHRDGAHQFYEKLGYQVKGLSFRKRL